MSRLVVGLACLSGDHYACLGACTSSGPARPRFVGAPQATIKRPCECPCHKRRGPITVELLRELAAQTETYACEERDPARATDAEGRARGFREAAQLLGRPREDS